MPTPSCSPTAIPDPDPTAHVRPSDDVSHPIALSAAEEERRSRLTVFFRLPLAIPHLVWLTLWGVVARSRAIVAWFAALFTGRIPNALHRFLSAYVLYSVHVSAFLWLIANPFPRASWRARQLSDRPRISERERQNRWITGFRLFLSLPAMVISSALGGALFAAGFLGLVRGAVHGRMPRGLARMGSYAVRYSGQAYGYALLLTDRYPYSGPVASDFDLAGEPA